MVAGAEAMALAYTTGVLTGYGVPLAPDVVLAVY